MTQEMGKSDQVKEIRLKGAAEDITAFLGDCVDVFGKNAKIKDVMKAIASNSRTRNIVCTGYNFSLTIE